VTFRDANGTGTPNPSTESNEESDTPTIPENHHAVLQSVESFDFSRFGGAGVIQPDNFVNFGGPYVELIQPDNFSNFGGAYTEMIAPDNFSNFGGTFANVTQPANFSQMG
jgi:hypothetical protein